MLRLLHFKPEPEKKIELFLAPGPSSLVSSVTYGCFRFMVAYFIAGLLSACLCHSTNGPVDVLQRREEFGRQPLVRGTPSSGAPARRWGTPTRTGLGAAAKFPVSLTMVKATRTA